MLPRALLIITILGATLVYGQEKSSVITLTDAILNARALYPAQLRGLQWIPGTAQYGHVKGDSLLRGTTGKGAEQLIATRADINRALPATDSLRRFPAVEWADGRTLLFTTGSRTYAYDVEKKTAALRSSVPDDAEDPDPDDAHRRVAFIRGNNLYITGAGDSVVQVTTDGTDGIVNGKSAHRQEYGITKGTFWSPDGARLAFYRMDETMVTPYYLEDISTTPSTFTKVRYPMAGQASHHVTLGIYDLRSRKTVFIQPNGPADHYLTNITWEPAGNHILITVLNRATDHFRVERFDASTGRSVRVLFEERNDKWLEPEHSFTFLKKTPTNFLHWSQRDGWWHLYLYDTRLGLVRQLTKGNWVVQAILGVDPSERHVFVEGTAPIDPKQPAGAMETHLYRVELATGKTTRLTKEPGTHRGKLSSDGRYLTDQWSSLTVPGRTEVRDAASGKVLKTLLASQDPLADVVHGTMELVQVQGEHGDVLNGRIIKPSFFQSRERYPVLVYTYNGPHVQLVTNNYLGGAAPWMLEAAERGYLVFTLDGHGSSNRGLAFEQAIHRQLGITEVKDQVHGAEWLKSLPYVDANRMAVHGWSFGGHMTTALLLRHPGLFHVGVAGGAVQDWRLYEVMYTERYMDTPEENPAGYAATTLSDSAMNLRDNLLLIHDNLDGTVVPQHALRFLKSCVDQGVFPDYFNYPGHEHNVRGKDRVHLYTQILDYIDLHLGVKR